MDKWLKWQTSGFLKNTFTWWFILLKLVIQTYWIETVICHMLLMVRLVFRISATYLSYIWIINAYSTSYKSREQHVGAFFWSVVELTYVGYLKSVLGPIFLVLRKKGLPKRKGSPLNHHFSGFFLLLVSGSASTYLYVHLALDKHPASQKLILRYVVKQLNHPSMLNLVPLNNNCLMVVSVGWLLQILTFFCYGWTSPFPSIHFKSGLYIPIFGGRFQPIFDEYFSERVVLQPPTSDSNRWIFLDRQVPETKGKTLEQKLGVFER